MQHRLRLWNFQRRRLPDRRPGSEISRSGSASPLGSYCAIEDKVCSTNADCSPDGNQTILSSNALRVLRAAVGQQVTLDCPTE